MTLAAVRLGVKTVNIIFYLAFSPIALHHAVQRIMCKDFNMEKIGTGDVLAHFSVLILFSRD